MINSRFQRVSARLNMNINMSKRLLAELFPACLCTAKYEYYGLKELSWSTNFQRVSARINMNMWSQDGILLSRFPACLCTAKYEYLQVIRLLTKEFPACLCTAKYKDQIFGTQFHGFQRVSARLNMNMWCSQMCRVHGFPACLCTAKYEYMKVTSWRSWHVSSVSLHG